MLYEIKFDNTKNIKTLEAGLIKEEILDVKWFDYDEIVNNMDEQLKGDYVKKAVYNQNNNLIAPIEIVNILKD